MASDLQVWEVTKPYLNLHCLLGEGPFYEEATNSLRFIDIRKHHLHTVDLAAAADDHPPSVHTLELDSTIGVTVDVEGIDPREKIAIGLKYGLALLDRKTGTYEYLRRFADSADLSKSSQALDFEHTRSNDGAADPHGRFWLGSMTDFDRGPFQPEGALFRFAAGGKSAELIRPDLTIPNGLGWSPDGRTMYFTHSSAKTVYAFDYDPIDGHISHERVLYQHAGPGEPDGFRVDADGYLWHAVYGPGRVLKISPTDGRVVGEVRLPTKNITCVQFVGTELFITTAADEAAADGSPSKELGGALFRVDVGVKGLPLYKFKLDA
ncbi:calcium homeostasis protein [Niveomyces insectorum RCEF 264]|uniref:Calcium homeostasis protein n=1 Tax=Niveomyces insectorum RCEF 264 TaxID=1081102 RepID=A0A167M2H1_9HYPO|nr:calcium homeostasis protein [Niveomyces insectorum RCEF 264]